MSTLFKDMTVTMTVRVLIYPLAIGTSVILARSLGPTLMGSFRVFALILGIATLFILFGLGSANVYFGAKDRDILPALTGNSVVAGILLGTVGALIILLISNRPDFQNYLISNNLEPNILRLFAWVLPISVTTTYLQNIIRASGDITRYNSVSLLRSMSMFLIVLIGVLIFDLGLLGAIIARTATELICAIWTLANVLLITKFRLSFSWKLFRRCFGFGIHLYPGNIMQFLNYRLDVFLVSFFLPPASVGYYTTAGGLAEKLWEFPHAIRTSLLHRVSGAKQSSALHLTTARIIRLLSLLMGIICILFALLSHWIILILYGRDFLPAVPALIALMPGIWTLSIGKIVAIHMAGNGRPEIGTYGAAVSLILTVTLDFLLIPRIGIIGAAITSSIAYSVSTLLMTAIFLRTSNLSISTILLPTSDDFKLLQSLLGDLGRRVSHRIFSYGETK